MTREEEMEVMPPTQKEIEVAYDVIAFLYDTSIDNVKKAMELFKAIPPAEGAEQRIRVRNILQDFYRRGEYELEQAEEDIMRLFQPQPTAEGAEEILRKNCNTCYSRSTGEEEVWSSVSSVLIAMQDFATLHAQRIAEKMVSERLREELMNFARTFNDTMDRPDDNYISTTDIDEYLKTRER